MTVVAPVLAAAATSIIAGSITVVVKIRRRRSRQPIDPYTAHIRNVLGRNHHGENPHDS